MLKFVALLIALVGLVPTARAQGTWSAVPCAETALKHPPLPCQANSSNRSAGSGIQAVTAYYAVSGWAGTYYANMLLQWPAGATFITTYTNADVIRFMKAFNNETRDGESWGELRSFGDTSYMTFKSKALSCVAFDKPGPYKTVGYAWILRGYGCQRSAVENPEAFVRMLIDKTTVGN